MLRHENLLVYLPALRHRPNTLHCSSVNRTATYLTSTPKTTGCGCFRPPSNWPLLPRRWTLLSRRTVDLFLSIAPEGFQVSCTSQQKCNLWKFWQEKRSNVNNKKGLPCVFESFSINYWLLFWGRQTWKNRMVCTYFKTAIYIYI